MGQYFTAALKKGNNIIVVEKKPRGMKLMEHSYVGNDYVSAVVKAIRSCEDSSCQVAWIGDYALSESLDKNSKDFFLSRVFGQDKKKYSDVLAMAKAVETKKNEITLSVSESEMDDYEDHYLLNMDKKQFIHVRKIGDGVIHPLAILTCSNPGSGGNYHPHEGEDDEKLFCSWCGDNIAYSKTKPSQEAWTEIKEDVFHED